MYLNDLALLFGASFDTLGTYLFSIYTLYSSTRSKKSSISSLYFIEERKIYSTNWGRYKIDLFPPASFACNNAISAACINCLGVSAWSGNTAPP